MEALVVWALACLLYGSQKLNNKVINALSVDVEDYFHVEAFSSVIPRNTWNQCEYRCERNVAKLLEILAEHRVRGTFFVLGWVAERSPQIVRDIARAGHEVACHGHSHQLVYRQSRAEFANELKRSKEVLEDLSGRSVLGFRAPSFSITRDSTWALDTLIDAGFTYDSSVFPIRHATYGIPGAPLEATLLSAPSGRTIIEYPLSVAPVLGLRLPVAGGGYFRLLPYAVTRFGINRINKLGRPAVFYIHPWEIDRHQPRVAAGLLSRFRHYNNIDRCEARFRRLLSDFAYAPMCEVLASVGLTVQTPPAARVLPKLRQSVSVAQAAT
jgi:polysaccharide deacetylase family protein (PEP-CTERM system associated)